MLWVCFWLTEGGAALLPFRGRTAFGNEVVLTDDGAFGNVAFGDMVAKTDALHHWATCTSALPKANRHSLSLFLGTQRV